MTMCLLALGHPVNMGDGEGRAAWLVGLLRDCRQRRPKVDQANLGLISNSALRQLPLGQ